MQNQNKPIKVLVVDDSYLMRRIIEDVLNTDPRVDVIATAKNGIEAVDKVQALQPDVVTLDVNMPEMDGTEALKKIMANSPVPVLMLSAFTTKDAEITMECLKLGAVDFITKPNGEISLNLEKIGEEIISKVIAAATSNVKLINDYHEELKTTEELFRSVDKKASKIVAIGSSTGGPAVLDYILSRISPNIKVPIVIAQHMPDPFIKSFVERLNKISAVQICRPESGQKVEAGSVYILPADGDYYLKQISRTESNEFVFARQDKNIKKGSISPSADVLFKSVANTFKGNSLAIVLTGMGRDGAEGIKEIKLAGGKVIAQDKNSSVIDGMPHAARETGMVDQDMNPDGIAKAINNYGQL